MPVYQGETEDDDHEKYPSDEEAHHIHYGADGKVAILTLREDGEDSDGEYEGEPYECPYCDETVDYDEEDTEDETSDTDEEQYESDESEEDGETEDYEDSEDRGEEDEDDEEESLF